MNKKHLIYSLQYAAVLASVLTFSSCKKDEFTAEQALDIENKRKQFQFDLDEKAKDNEAARANFMMWQARKIDSLQRVNAGGQVFYSVAVVPGGSTAFGQGRYEEVGLDNIEVTVEQYGFVYTEKTTKGIAYFKKPLFSGEATVTVDASGQGYTSVTYISNLTPDGGVPNDGTVFVGNIIPVFDNDPSKETAADNMAMISGKAWADLDLTTSDDYVDGNTNAPNEEPVPDGVTFTAVIDVNRTEFKDKYLRENFEEGGIHIGGSGNTPGTGVATKSGFIQRIAYEKASTISRVSNGDYSMMVAATASGLPMKLRYSDFAYDRTYVNDNGATVSERCLYGPEVVYNDDMTYGEFNLLYDYDVNLVQTDATITATLTAGTSPQYYTDGAGYKWLVPVNGQNRFMLAGLAENRYQTSTSGSDLGVTSSNNAGAYLHAPTITFSAPDLGGGVQTVGTPIMYNFKTTGGSATTATTPGTNAYYYRESVLTREGGINLRGIRGVSLTTVGSGYSTPPAVTITPVFPGGAGTGSLQASSSGISYIRVINGGYGYVYNSAVHHGTAPSYPGGGTVGYSTVTMSTIGDLFSVPGQFTGVAPTVEFNGGVVPAGGTSAVAVAVMNTTIGTIDEVTVTGAGSNYSPSTSAIVIKHGQGAALEYVTPDATGDGIFNVVTAGGGYTIAFRDSGGADATNIYTVASGATPTINPAEINFTAGRGYTFVPSVQVTNFRGANGLSASPVVSNLEIRAIVEGQNGADGPVVGLSILGAPGVTYTGAAAGDELRATFNIVPVDPRATAVAFLSGSGIDNYVVTDLGANYSSVAGQNTPTHTGGSATFTTAMYDYYTFAGSSMGGPGGGFCATTAITALPTYDASDSDYDVEFYGATALAGTSGVVNPTAVPVFQSGGGTLAGIRLFSGGANIAPAAVAGGTAIQWRIIPRGYKAGMIKAQLSPATLTFTIADGGLGYAVRPDVILTTDKLTYIQTAALNNIDNYKFNINGAGTITEMWFSPLAAGASAVMTLLNDPASGTLNAPVITVAAQEQELYEQSSLAYNVDNGFSTDGGFMFYPAGGSIVAEQDIIGNGADDAAWLTYAGNTSNAIMHWPQATPTFGDNAEVLNAYYTSFTLTGANYATLVDFNSGSIIQTLGAPGDGASATAYLKPESGEVDYVELTSGGSGYVDIIAFNEEPITKNFTVFGGPDGYKFNSGAIFETYSGIQYVRDIHYGIGKRIH